MSLYLQIYKNGFAPSWVSGSQGALLDDFSKIVVRPGTNYTLSGVVEPFAQFSMVTTDPFCKERYGCKVLNCIYVNDEKTKACSS